MTKGDKQKTPREIFKTDSSPTKPEERSPYVAQVYSFYNNIAKDQFEVWRYEFLGLLVNPDNSKEADVALKACISNLATIEDWFIRISAEHDADKFNEQALKEDNNDDE